MCPLFLPLSSLSPLPPLSLPSLLSPSPPSSLSPPSSPPPLSTAIHAREQANTKKTVGNVLALNLVTQLYRIGAIQPAKAPGAKKSAAMVRGRGWLYVCAVR